MSTLNEGLTDKEIVVSNSKEIAAELKEILFSLKKVMENGEEIQPGDKRLFSLLLKNLRTKVQMELFNKLLDNNPNYASLSAALETKIKDFKKELEEISEKNNKNLNYNNSQERVLERLIKSLEDSKKDLDKQNIISASTHLLENYNVQEILDSCTSSLGLSYKGFNPYLDIDYNLKPSRRSMQKETNIDFKIIDKIIGIIGEDESVKNEIVKYHKCVQSYDKEKSILEDNESLLHLLQIVKPYVDQIISIYKNAISFAEKEKESKYLNKEIEEDIPRRKSDLQGSIVAKLLNSGEIKKYDSLLYKYKFDLHKISLDIKDIKRNTDELIKEIMDNVKDNNSEDLEVLKNIIDLKECVVGALNSYSYELPYTYINGPIDYEYIFNLFLSIIRGKNAFINAIIRMENLVSKGKKELVKKEDKKAKAYEKLSDKAKEYADSDIYSAKYCVDVINSESTFHKTPVICAFILHILSQSEKLSFDDLLEVVNLAADIDIAKLEEDYNNIINKYVNEFNDNNDNAIRDYERMYDSNNSSEAENIENLGDLTKETVIENDEETLDPVSMRQKYIDSKRMDRIEESKAVIEPSQDVVSDNVEGISEIPTIFETDEFSPYTMPQMSEEAYSGRVRAVDKYLKEKFGYNNSSQYDKDEPDEDSVKLL